MGVLESLSVTSVRTTMLTVVLLFFLGVLWIIYMAVKKPRQYPPGPAWLPVIGCYKLFRKMLTRLGYVHLVLSWLADKYGPVVGLRLGTDKIILVSGPDAIHEVLGQGDFDGRPDGFFFQLRTFGARLGIVFSDGPFWQEQRRFCLHHLRHFGFGKRGMEIHIETEASDLVVCLKNQCSSPIQMSTAFDMSVLNSLWAILAGERFALNDNRLVKLLEIVHSSFRLVDASGGLLNQMPFLRYIAPKQCGYKQILYNLEQMWAFLAETISEHKLNYSEGSARDLIDAFLHEMENMKNKENSTFTEKQLLSLCLDLFMAGSETTSNTLGFAILYMLIHPDKQKQVQDELDEVVGRDRQPSYQDRTRLSYVEAVLMEVQRIANIAPVGIPHRAVRDTVLMGYKIPQGSTVLVNLWSLHMDQDHWGDPEVFRPERFLDNGKVRQDDWFIPFGYGKRRCLGETLAKTSLFIFFSSILHNFTLSVPPGTAVPSTQAFDGVTLAPKPFYALLVPRS